MTRASGGSRRFTRIVHFTPQRHRRGSREIIELLLLRPLPLSARRIFRIAEAMMVSRKMLKRRADARGRAWRRGAGRGLCRGGGPDETDAQVALRGRRFVTVPAMPVGIMTSRTCRAQAPAPTASSCRVTHDGSPRPRRQAGRIPAHADQGSAERTSALS